MTVRRYPPSPGVHQFDVSTRTTWITGLTSNDILAEIAAWWRGLDQPPGADFPERKFVNHGHVAMRIAPGDGTQYAMILTDLDGARFPGRPIVALSLLDSIYRSHDFGPITLNAGDGPLLPYAHEVGYVAGKLQVPAAQYDGVACSIAHVATLLLGLATITITEGGPS